MVYLKLYESFSNIDAICKRYEIENYTINSDGSIDVDGDISFFNLKYPKIPLEFGKVSGEFDCRLSKLTSLEGCPKEVGGHFFCNINRLTSLDFSPEIVRGNFVFASNRIKSLKGCPSKVGGVFNCDHNQLTSLDGCPREVGGDFSCKHNPVSVVYELIEDIVKKDYYNLIEFVENWNPIRLGKVIILDRLNDYLETFGGEPVTSVEGYKCI